MAKKKVSKKTTAKKSKPAVKEEINLRGRPSKYVDINLEQVEKFCKLGATDAELADFLGVTETTINNWKLEHDDFFESVTRGKRYSDEEVVASLYAKALGGIKELRKDKLNKDGDVVTLTEEVLVVADTKACEFWLKNRRPDEWREKREIDHSGSLSFLDMANELDAEIE